MKEKQIRVRLPLIVYVDGLIFYDAQNQLLSETIGSDTTSYTHDTKISSKTEQREFYGTPVLVDLIVRRC